jgi:hypothetical protein
MSSNKNIEANPEIPSFFIRWYLFFRRYPGELINPRFLFDVIIKRNPIFWNNFMRIENRRRIDKMPKEISQTPLSKGNWRVNDNEKAPINRSSGKWIEND